MNPSGAMLGVTHALKVCVYIAQSEGVIMVDLLLEKALKPSEAGCWGRVVACSVVCIFVFITIPSLVYVVYIKQ